MSSHVAIISSDPDPIIQPDHILLYNGLQLVKRSETPSSVTLDEKVSSQLFRKGEALIITAVM
jgi:hypothetical protein